jgi:hypothetical protein
MDGAIYLLSREVKGTEGESYMQNVTVFAESPAHAKAIVEQQFARLRSLSKTHQPAYQQKPDFAVDKVGLEQHKLITAGVTSW